MDEDIKELIYIVNFILEYNIALPERLTETQLKNVVKEHSRPAWRRNRNFGFTVTDGTYIKIDLKRVMALDAKPIGYINQQGNFVEDKYAHIRADNN